MDFNRSYERRRLANISRSSSGPSSEGMAIGGYHYVSSKAPLVGGETTILEQNETQNPTYPVCKPTLSTIISDLSNKMKHCYRTESSDTMIKMRKYIYKLFKLQCKLSEYSRNIGDSKKQGGYNHPTKEYIIRGRGVNKTVNKRRRLKKKKTYRKVRNISIKTHKKKFKHNKATKRKRRY